MGLKRTRCYASVWLLFLLFAPLDSGLAQDTPEDSFKSLFNGRDTDGWRVEGVRVGVRDGVLSVGPGKGWIRTDQMYGDYVLAFDLRVSGRSPSAEIVVRTPPTARRTMRDAAFSVSLTSPKTTAVTPAGYEWHTVEVECRAKVVTVRLDGQVIVTDDTAKFPQGFVGFAARSGVIDLKNVRIKQLFPPPSTVAGTYTPLKQVDTLPIVVRDVKPRYTSEAVALGFSGEVWLEVEVKADGSVGMVRVIRSLDPEHGLDDEATAAARQWRFKPATVAGRPVAVLVTISLAFTLGR